MIQRTSSIATRTSNLGGDAEVQFSAPFELISSLSVEVLIYCQWEMSFVTVYRTALKHGPLFLLEEALEHGPFTRINDTGTSVFLASHPRLLSRIFKRTDIYHKSAKFAEIGSKVFGQGILTAEGDAWSLRRKIMGRCFRRSVLLRLNALTSSVIVNQLETWHKRSARGETLNMTQEIFELSVVIICKLLFSGDFRRDDPVVNHILSIDHVMTGNPEDNAVRDSIERSNLEIYEFLDKTIALRSVRVPARKDLLQCLIDSTSAETDNCFTPRMVADEAKTLLFAGHDTVASATLWIFFVLASKPEVNALVFRELDKVVLEQGIAENYFLTQEQLPYLHEVLQEALRLYPPVWQLSRTATIDDEHLGYKIAKGSTILISPFVMHRHPTYWDMAGEFLSHRFAIGQRKKVTPLTNIPFGHGKRACIGQYLGKALVLSIVSSILRRFDVEIENRQWIAPKLGISQYPDPLIARFRPRRH